MTRRTFAAALAGTAAITNRSVTLEAISGEHLPATLRVSKRGLGDSPYFELRLYRAETLMHARLEDVFSHAGMHPVALGNLRFLLPFESLKQRVAVWDQLNCNPRWIAVRERVRLSGLTIYRARQPGGRIFEMSL